MNRIVLGAIGALVLVAIGLFWLQGRAEVEEGAPPPDIAPGVSKAPDPEVLPSADVTGLEGPKPPEVDEFTREQQRFFRLDRNRDGKVTRNELLATRTNTFRKLDTDGNNLLTFEEWAISTSKRFEEMDANGDGIVTPAETTAFYRKQEK